MAIYIIQVHKWQWRHLSNIVELNLVEVVITTIIIIAIVYS